MPSNFALVQAVRYVIWANVPVGILDRRAVAAIIRGMRLDPLCRARLHGRVTQVRRRFLP